MAYITLSGKRGKGHRTLVDDSTFKKYGHLTWHLSDTGYAVRRNRSEGGTVRLHRLVANTPEGLFTDHKNHDRLDNRKSNLRVVSHAENMANYKGEKGYTWDASKSKWMVRYKGIFYGRYATEAEAQRAYQLACSGVPRVDRLHPRRKFLPRGVMYMQPQAQKGDAPYYIRPQIQGKRYFRGFFSKVEDAEKVYNNLIKELQQED